ncbi:MAG: diadenylate cyclase CdaA [Fodinibius sp.]|nr:diadenylate cyclase CdaA [Fodinibius sp.]
MLETIGVSLQDFVRNVRIIDLLDIGLISVVFYLLLNWLIQSLSRRTLIGFSTLFVIYVFARLTGMYLTELLIQALFIVILIGLVVVFQSDIRRVVDRIGTWTFFGNNDSPSYSNTATDIITEAVSKMAANNTGALIVIRGHEGWERHIDGGIELNGRLSIPMLYSIFNPKAPGHDGAVLLEGDKIVRFGVHLPLSKNMSKTHAGGTRHAAALGISEHCDALVVVVSEESGTISVAQDGRLVSLDSSSDLKNRLDTFWNEHYQLQDTPLIDWWKKRNLRTAMASVTLAVVLWIAFAYPSGTVYRTFSVPIEYLNLQSSNVSLQDSLPMQARVTLSGSEQAFRSLDPSELIVSFNLSEERLKSNELAITENELNLSKDLQLYDVSPKTLNVEPVKKAQLPVKVSLQGSLPDQLELAEVSVKPHQVTVTTPQERSTLDSISTEVVDLSTIEQTSEITRQLILPKGITLPEKTPREVVIVVTVQKKTN